MTNETHSTTKLETQVVVQPKTTALSPYDAALSLMPFLLFLGAIFAILKGGAWMKDRTAREVQDFTQIGNRLDELEKGAKVVSSLSVSLHDHERRITVIETDYRHINTTLDELKVGIKQLNDNVLDLAQRLPRKGV